MIVPPTTRTFLLTLLLVLGTVWVGLGQTVPEVYVPKPGSIPDLTQTDPKGEFAGGGGSFCGPVAVSNSLYAYFRDRLEEDEQDHYHLARELASIRCMNTHLKTGTNVKMLMHGVENYLRQFSITGYYFKFQGWRMHDLKHHTPAPQPKLSWMKKIIAYGGAVWVNVGWYDRTGNPNTLRRRSGHWVTVVGYGVNEKGEKDPECLLIHDPAPRAGREPRVQHIKLVKMDPKTTLNGTMRNLPRPAVDLYRMEGEMELRRGVHCAIMDGAVGLLLEEHWDALKAQRLAER